MLSDTEYNELLAHSYDSKKLKEYLENKNGTSLVQRISGERIDEEIVIDDNRFGIYTKYIKDFVTIFNSRFSKYNNSALVNNLKTLEIVEVDEIEQSEAALAMYDKDSNKVFIKRGYKDEDSLRHYLYHELLHMATTYVRGPIYLSGFAQTVLPGFGIGASINEGVTELITRRVFCKEVEGDENYIYGFEKNMVFILESIVSTDKLYEYYFNGDLLGLIDELALHFDRDIANQILLIFGMFHISKGNDRPMLYLKIKDILSKLFIKMKSDSFVNQEIDIDELEFAKLKSSLNMRGYNINKRPTVYGFFNIDTNDIYRITPDMYRIVMNYYKNTNEFISGSSLTDCTDYNLIEMFYALLYLEHQVDLSTVESVKVIDYDNKDFEVTYMLEEDYDYDEDDPEVSDLLAEFNRVRRF